MTWKLFSLLFYLDFCFVSLCTKGL
uniref:Uncharacterized protein n=1 Tax=Arundo donax TaxID=35708 RepID=A0A0A8ZI17_ARUDO